MIEARGVESVSHRSSSWSRWKGGGELNRAQKGTFTSWGGGGGAKKRREFTTFSSLKCVG